MHVFLDSNALYEDYFFENASNQKLLAYARQRFINLYMSEIVKLELRNQYIKELEKKISEISKLKKRSDRLKISLNITDISLEEQLKVFDKFYTALNGIDNFMFLPVKDSFMSDIIKKAVNKAKPFFENDKSQFKDAVIWKTYSMFVLEMNFEKCFLLTANSNDFLSKNDPTKIHEELSKDCNKFVPCKDSTAFIKEYGTIFETPEYRFKQYFQNLKLNDELIEKIVLEYMPYIEDHVHEHAESLHPHQLLKTDYIIDGQVIPYEVELLHCSIISSDLYKDSAMISCILNISCDVEILEYNASKDFGEDSFRSVFEQCLLYNVHCHFDLKENEIIQNFEISYLQRDHDEEIYNERRYMQNKLLITLLKKYKGQAKYFILKSGEKIPAGIHQIDEANNTVTFIYGQALLKLKEAQEKGESSIKFFEDSNNYSTIPISEIENVI